MKFRLVSNFVVCVKARQVAVICPTLPKLTIAKDF